MIQGGNTSAQGSRLASLCPTTTSPELAFTAEMPTEVTRLYAANVTGGAVTMRLWHVEAGDSVADKYALLYDYSIAAGETLQLFADAPNSGIKLEEGDELHVRSASANALAFNFYGVTASIAPGTSS